MHRIAERRIKIAAARADFLRFGRAETQSVPGLVAASWHRSVSAGVDAASSQAVFHGDLDLTGRLMRCSEPVIARLSDEMAEMPLSIVLTDYKARILSRSETDRTIGTLLDDVSLAPGFNYAEANVGTNGIGTVLESGQPLYIVGPEHYLEHLQPFACAGSPIRDPLTGRVEGVLDISCLSEHSSPLMQSLVRSAAHEIERNLLVDRSQRQQALFEAYVRVDAHTRGAVMAIGGTVVMGNAVAQSLFAPDEQWTIHEHARYLMIAPGQPIDEIELPSGKVVHIRGKRVVVGPDVAGIVVVVDIVSEPAAAIGVGPVAVAAAAAGFGLSLLPPARREPRPSARLSEHSRAPSAERESESHDVAAILSDMSSLLGKRASASVVSALTAGSALLVLGEEGGGKVSLVAELFGHVVPTGRSAVYGADELNDHGLQHFLDRDSSRAAGQCTLHIFRNIDRLNPPAIAQLDAFLSARATTAKELNGVADGVAVTVSQPDLQADLVAARPYTALLHHFETSVTVAPLRHRINDLSDIVTRVLARRAGLRPATVSAGAMRVISRYPWPGNIRQLEEALDTALLARPVGAIQAEDLPAYCHGGAPRVLSALEAGERDLIVGALHKAEGNRMRAAESLGIARSSLYRKLKSFGITVTES
ncbi:helix-turn-helix domain-containing protein [Cryobacterium sp. PH29-G1]|uniref:sigma-54-dependent Fis family transcriptional regulator n=1 Tax=Cryobacterium sp. PH29-G1 TaxID=3046211 RepID=UPI0024B95362|nr:helix-turn-helix domain-containing protein [Cryobacterium sp. PH29-G1]MDJ0350189.1 helix-turn-helix domain-containing protein [Cryobacterium sp. PH29-G1]